VYSSKVFAHPDSRGGDLRPSPACLITYEITGSGFLRHMVRTIAGSLLDVGQGRRSPEWLSEVLASCDRAQAGPTAPAHGLFLVGVDYAGPA
jgi:tRNA pseudouridine38-40 synthase